MKITRRTFLKDASLLIAGLGLSQTLTPSFAEALEELAGGRAPLLWLQGQSCSGCSVSLLNSTNPGPADLLTRYLSLYFHQTISAATGESAQQSVEKAISTGGYILAIEGAIPLTVKDACRFADEDFADLLTRAASKAKAVVSVGTCAAFGGIPAAPPNLTGAVSVATALQKANVNVPVINLPGCPSHPSWMIGSLVHVLKIGIPELDKQGRPLKYYSQNLHEQCPYFAQYQKKNFAKALGDEGCLFKMGCQGVVTQANCSMHAWNGGTNWCIRARSNCIGCARPEFARDRNFPFFRLNEKDLHV